ncbi:hypothetical protein HFO55_25570 [Rhizobium leguminosarum]|jgi:hypothetical protein|uniref:DUF3329 domain-containing protein n=2 Tax=Rhizobium TaxID=379 RepID=A0ABR6G3C7_9HYPH|nr:MULTISPECIES: hypothetical protein [Rhizobium]ANP86750.1 hypothetical protein BA011_14085 [Rhizobium leguminosarum]MBB3160782.1 hypothetical protein [Rhizobium laguerreae]MBN9986651.1 hypothetical protein [Rhizobium laguerreae]MBY3068929.1 hypothetical protein [Rhizobium laguerreae]MBY3084941.1 hypothetical protein [Rhizobium laguerreae]
MQLIDPNHPAYRRLWVRVAIVAVCFGWAVVEFVTGDPFWGVLAGGAGAYSFYILFWTFKPQPPATEPVVQPDAEEEEGPAATAEKPSKDGQAE